MLVEDLTLIKILPYGDSNFDLYLSSKIGDNRKFTTKVVEKSALRTNFNKAINNEISILLDTNHPNILKFYEIKENDNKIFIVEEYFYESLECFFERNKIKYISEESVQYIMRQIVDAIKYLHNKKIIHRNLNLENIAISYDDENNKINNNIMKAKIKIINFTSARYLNKGEMAYIELGSPLYMEPSILFKLRGIPEYKDKGYDEKADIWSIGIIFYQLLTGKMPFEADDMQELVEKTEKGNYYVPTAISKEAFSFLNCMLQFDPKKRTSIDILYNHDFLRKDVNNFKKINENIHLDKIKVNIYKNNELLTE